MDVIALAGQIGSGKSTLARAFAARNNHLYIGTGDFLRKLLAKSDSNYIERSKIQDFFINEFKNDWRLFCRTIFRDVSVKNSVIIVDSLRGIDSYYALCEYFVNSNVYVVYCDVDAETAARRQLLRGDIAVITKENSLNLRDFDDLSFFKENADIVINMMNDFQQAIEELQNWFILKGR